MGQTEETGAGGEVQREPREKHRWAVSHVNPGETGHWTNQHWTRVQLHLLRSAAQV